MIDCVFDGSFNGLLTLVFDTWRIRDKVASVIQEPDAGSLLPQRFYYTQDNKASRVREYIDNRMGEEFAFLVKAAFLSSRPERFRAIVNTIHRACEMGPKALGLLEDDVLCFLDCHKEVTREAHRFQGLLRLREMADGSLLAVFAPRHHVLPLIMPHFADRFPGENLIIYDEGRHIAGLSEKGVVNLARVAGLQPQDSDGERELEELWRVFFSRLAIKERLNPRLQMQHMPRYTWKHLPEMRETP
ncbi:MAG: TIGR03915 family putative DNA repair protein [Eubacteriales bacterium]|nr:TIGR03915 family putative DNA repair protein [Eubacteriales bacterium]